jgi:hypothetical protein
VPPSPPDRLPLWRLDGFEERFDQWVAREQPSAELQAVVAEWIPTRKLDPYRGARPEPQVDGLWWMRVPGTSDGFRVVICSYFPLAADRVVRCALFGTVGLPV